MEYTVSYCVNSVLADMGEVSKRHYQKFLHYGIQGFRRLNLGNMVNTTIKTASLEVDSATKTAKLPLDYVDYLKVGYVCNGVIINLDNNSALMLGVSDVEFPAACDCQSELEQCQGAASSDSTDMPLLSNLWYYTPYYHNGQYVAGVYGLGAGHYRNSYRIDRAKGEIQFDSYITADFVVMEYISNGIDNGDAYIEESLVPAITAYIHWKAALHDTTKNRLEAQMFERIWKQEARGVMARKAAMTSWDWVQIWRRSLTATVKR